jgi:PPOX class probable F420-dependent enzyme
MTTIPDSHRDLLERPLIAHLATVSPAGRPQSNPMWFVWDGENIRFTHTNTRRKYDQLRQNPHLALSIVDPDTPYRYLEVRGEVTDIVDDPQGELYAQLSARYGTGGQPPKDAPTRVVLVVHPTHVTTMG